MKHGNTSVLTSYPSGLITGIKMNSAFLRRSVTCNHRVPFFIFLSHDSCHGMLPYPFIIVVRGHKIVGYVGASGSRNPFSYSNMGTRKVISSSKKRKKELE